MRSLLSPTWKVMVMPSKGNVAERLFMPTPREKFSCAVDGSARRLDAGGVRQGLLAICILCLHLCHLCHQHLSAWRWVPQKQKKGVPVLSLKWIPVNAVSNVCKHGASSIGWRGHSTQRILLIVKVKGLVCDLIKVWDVNLTTFGVAVKEELFGITVLPQGCCCGAS